MTLHNLLMMRSIHVLIPTGTTVWEGLVDVQRFKLVARPLHNLVNLDDYLEQGIFRGHNTCQRLFFRGFRNYLHNPASWSQALARFLPSVAAISLVWTSLVWSTQNSTSVDRSLEVYLMSTLILRSQTAGGLTSSRPPTEALGNSDVRLPPPWVNPVLSSIVTV